VTSVSKVLISTTICLRTKILDLPMAQLSIPRHMIGIASFIVAIIGLSNAQSTVLPLLFDPGPSHVCYQYRAETSSNYDPDPVQFLSECEELDDPGRIIPAWEVSSFNADAEFSPVSSTGGNGESFTVTLVNNAQGLGNCQDGTQSEPNLGYWTPGYTIRKIDENTEVSRLLPLYLLNVLRHLLNVAKNFASSQNRNCTLILLQ
jgi:hypothetical protein